MPNSTARCSAKQAGFFETARIHHPVNSLSGRQLALFMLLFLFVGSASLHGAVPPLPQFRDLFLHCMNSH